MTSTPSGADRYQLLTFSLKAGDLFYFTGQKTKSGTQITLRLISPDEKNTSPDASTLAGSLYGKQLYIYPLNTANKCQYKVNDVHPPLSTVKHCRRGIPVATRSC